MSLNHTDKTGAALRFTYADEPSEPNKSALVALTERVEQAERTSKSAETTLAQILALCVAAEDEVTGIESELVYDILLLLRGW